MALIDVVICEESGDWSALLRRHLPAGAALIQTRHLDELWTCLREAPRAVAAIELRVEHGPEVLECLRRLDRQIPDAVPIVLAHRDVRDWEELCREVGATAFILGLRSIGDVAEIVGGLVRSQTAWSKDTDEQMPLEDRIFANLPWGH